MQPSHAPLLLVALLAAPLAAQNLVTNGDFTNGSTGWVLVGYSYNPAFESFDTVGLGPSPCFGCSPGGLVAPGPFPPNAIEQTVSLAAGLPDQLTAEIAVDGSATSSNLDAGTFWVEVGGVEVTRTSLGVYTAGLLQRARLCARFTPVSGGPQTLRINFARAYVATAVTPRTHIDDIKLQAAIGPTFCLRGNRRLGTTRNVDAIGTPSVAVLFFLSPSRLSRGVPIPGIHGTWFLDPMLLFFFFNGATDASGQYGFTLPLPGDPALLTAVIWVQGLEFTPAPQINAGYDQILTFVR